MIKKWADSSSEELKNTKVVILPIGAVEQHGLHLPVGTDFKLDEAILDNLIETYGKNLDLKILPLLNYGKSVEHLSFPGTINISATTLINLIGDIAYSLSIHGVSTMFILNGHGGNSGILDGLIFDIKTKYNIDTYLFNLGQLFTEYGEMGTFPFSMHAGFAETSIMKYSYPQYEHLYNKISDSSTNEAMKKMMNFENMSWGWKTEEISSIGSIGRADLSTKEDGEKLIKMVVKTIYTQIKNVLE